MSCAATQPINGAALAGAVGDTVGRAQVQKQIAPVCPTPTQWTREQKLAVADTLQKYSDDVGIRILAPEWQRLNQGANKCRGTTP